MLEPIDLGINRHPVPDSQKYDNKVQIDPKEVYEEDELLELRNEILKLLGKKFKNKFSLDFYLKRYDGLKEDIFIFNVFRKNNTSGKFLEYDEYNSLEYKLYTDGE